MSVIITNVTKPGVPDDEEHEYVLYINGPPIIARFTHIRDRGLAACLRAAADAVEEAEGRGA